MTTDITEKPKDDDSGEHKFNRKEIIHLGFQNKTRGEAAFNAISYIGFGYFVVTATSVLMTWLLRDSKIISPVFEKYISKPVSSFFKVDTSVMNIATLFAGGTLASVLPVKWLEDRKSKAVKKLDYMLYDEDRFYNDPKIQAAHKELDELPKQTWTTVFVSRVVAFVATFGVLFAIGSNKSPFAKWTGHSLDEASIKLGRGIDHALGKSHTDVVDGIKHAIEENKSRMVSNYGDEPLAGFEVIRDKTDKKTGKVVKGDRIASRVYSYIGLDAFYTLITSASLWVSTRVLGAVLGQDAKPNTQHDETIVEYHPKSTVSKAVANEPAQDASPTSPTPPTKVTSPVRLERVAEPQQSAELTA